MPLSKQKNAKWLLGLLTVFKTRHLPALLTAQLFFPFVELLFFLSFPLYFLLRDSLSLSSTLSRNLLPWCWSNASPVISGLDSVIKFLLQAEHPKTSQDSLPTVELDLELKCLTDLCSYTVLQSIHWLIFYFALLLCDCSMCSFCPITVSLVGVLASLADASCLASAVWELFLASSSFHMLHCSPGFETKRSSDF